MMSSYSIGSTGRGVSWLSDLAYLAEMLFDPSGELFPELQDELADWAQHARPAHHRKASDAIRERPVMHPGQSTVTKPPLPLPSALLLGQALTDTPPGHLGRVTTGAADAEAAALRPPAELSGLGVRAEWLTVGR
jgi:hypothetical protein